LIATTVTERERLSALIPTSPNTSQSQTTEQGQLLWCRWAWII